MGEFGLRSWCMWRAAVADLVFAMERMKTVTVVESDLNDRLVRKIIKQKNWNLKGATQKHGRIVIVVEVAFPRG